MILNSLPVTGFLEIIKEYNKSNIVVAEIGTYIGATTVEAANLVKQFKGNYIAVDWFQGSPDTFGPHKDNSLENKSVLDIFTDNIKEAGVDNIIDVYNMTSLESATQIPDKSLDICFLDADHKYDHIKADIEAFLPKMKPGGILCGHDFEPPAIQFLGDITERELTQDYVPRLVTSQNHIYQIYGDKIINSELIRSCPELFYFHPGVVKAVSERFNKEDIKFYSNSVWAVKVN
jgi:hypothetical protein